MRMRMNVRQGGVMLDDDCIGDSVVITPLERPRFEYIASHPHSFLAAAFKVYSEDHGEVTFAMGGKMAQSLAHRFVVGKPIRVYQVKKKLPGTGGGCWYKLQVDDVKLPGSDISSEEWREYDLEDETYRIEKPLRLFVGDTTHRVLDSEGITHCVPKGGVIRWKATPWMAF